MQPVHWADNPATFMCHFSRNSGGLNLLEPSGPVQAHKWIAGPSPYSNNSDTCSCIKCRYVNTLLKGKLCILPQGNQNLRFVSLTENSLTEQKCI